MLVNFQISGANQKIYIFSATQENPTIIPKSQTHNNPKPSKNISMAHTTPPPLPPLKCSSIAQDDKTHAHKPTFDPHSIDPNLVQKMEYDALVWSSLHGLLVGDRSSQKSGRVPGVGLVHAPISLLPMPFAESYWKQACEVAPIFNELVDRVSLDSEFLQESLSRFKGLKFDL